MKLPVLNIIYLKWFVGKKSFYNNVDKKYRILNIKPEKVI